MPAEETSQTPEQENSDEAAKQVLRDELANERVERARAEGVAKGQATALAKQPVLETPKAEPEEERLTLEQLQALVDDGKINEGQRTQRLLDYQRIDLEKDFDAKLAENNTAQTANHSIQAAFDAYTDRMPDLLKEGSENFERASAEYQRLIKECHCPATAATQLVAVGNIFGPAKLIKETTKRETHSEGAGGTSGSGTSKPEDNQFKGLTAVQSAYIQRGIDKGKYSDEQGDKNLKRDIAYARSKNEVKH